MKACYSVKWILIGALMTPGLTACSFFGGGDEPAEEVAAEEGEEGGEGGEEEAADPAAAENAETVGTDETMASETEGAEAAADAAVAGAETGAPTSEIPPELLGANAAMGAEGTGVPAETAMPAVPESTPMPAAQPPMMTPSSDMRVYYVNVPGLAVKDRPEANASPVGNLTMGDPVLVKVEGNWANIVNRGWVELSSLSTGPVGRSKSAKSWN